MDATSRPHEARVANRLTLPGALAVFCYLLAFAQRPGMAYSDSRAELTVDPGLMLDRIGSLWSTTADLGHVQSGQFVGYLLPMGSWFAGAQAVGIPLWIAERLWLGTLMALSAWGAIKLMDALYGRPRGIAHAVAGLLYAVNPFVIVFTSRGSVTLLAYCVLPWMLVAAHRGLAEPRRWRWPVALALLFALAGGGVNAAVVVWILLAPVALLAYEVALRDRTIGDAQALAWRAAVCGIAASVWWMVPVTLQGLYGSQFLSFTEQPGSIWATTSLAESLRLLGYWVTYFGGGFGNVEPTMHVAGTYLFATVVIVATFAVPLIAFGSTRLTRSWRYSPFFVLLGVLTLLAMSAGFPEGKPLERAMTTAYYDFPSVQVLRTGYKAGPLLALAFAALGGAGSAALVARARAGEMRVPRLGWALPVWALWPLVAVPVIAALPMFTGKAIDRDLAYDHVPTAWRHAMSDVDKHVPPNTRTMIVPGQVFGVYQWGRTLDPVATALARTPVLDRNIVRYADARSSQLQASVDDEIQQQRLVPGQLPPLLALMSVGQVVVPTDGRPEQSGELPPADVDAALRAQPGFARPLAAYGSKRRFTPAAGRSGPTAVLPELRRYAGPVDTRGILRVESQREPTLLEGDADGVIEAAAHVHGLDPASALFYAGDLNAFSIRDRVAQGARLVMTDSNRRRPINASRFTENRGPTVGPADKLERELASYDLFPRGADDETVALYSGLRYLRSPRALAFAILPEYRPYAAFDGRLDRPWIASGQKSSQRWLEFALAKPKAVRSIEVYPHADQLGRTLEIGLSENGGNERRIKLHAGWNTVPIRTARLDRLRIRIVKVKDVFFTGRGGLDEIRVPGVQVRERLRLPIHLADSTRGLDLSRNDVSVLLERTTADVPYRAGNETGNPQADNPIDMVDAEPGIARRIRMPVARSFRIDGWASFDPAADDTAFDALTALPAGWRMTSSSRFEGIPANRASSAFDRDPSSAWIGDWVKGQSAWIELDAPRAFRVKSLLLNGKGVQDYYFPSRIRVTTDNGTTAVLRVGAYGNVDLPEAVRTRRLRIDIIKALPPAGFGGARLLRGLGVSQISIAGLRVPTPKRAGTFATSCGSLRFRAGGSVVSGFVRGTIAQLDAGGPLPISTCGAKRALDLRAGDNDFDAPAGPLVRPDHVRLLSPAQRALAEPSGTAPPRVVDAGHGSSTNIDGVRLALDGPSWLVLGQSFSTGWRAWCTDRSGRERGLGVSQPIDVSANGWRVGSDCVKARFAFVPQRAATAAYVISAAALLALLVGCLVAIVRRRRRGGEEPDACVSPSPSTHLPLAPADPLRKLGWSAAIALALGIGLVGGIVLALRAGVVLFVATVLFARVGASVRRLVNLATVALAAVPILYLARPAVDLGGFNFGYAYHHLAAHWAAATAVCALFAAGALQMAAVRRAGAPEQPASQLPVPAEATPGDPHASERRRRRVEAAAVGRRR